MKDIFAFTAKAFQIPAVLVDGSIQGTEDAQGRFLTGCIDPICDQRTEEINRKGTATTGSSAATISALIPAASATSICSPTR